MYELALAPFNESQFARRFATVSFSTLTHGDSLIPMRIPIHLSRIGIQLLIVNHRVNGIPQNAHFTANNTMIVHFEVILFMGQNL